MPTLAGSQAKAGPAVGVSPSYQVNSLGHALRPVDCAGASLDAGARK